MRTALSHAPENRYPTAAAMREAIEDAMVEAMVPTTTGDVAAFAIEHVAERAEKRRQSIELALAAAAERQRIEELLRPPSDRSSTGFMTATPVSGSQPQMMPAPSTGSLPADRTMPEAPTAKANPGDAIAKLTPRLSEPPAPGSLSYATLGSASLDASEAPPQRSRKGLVAIVALLAAVAAGATVVSFAMFKGSPKMAPAAAANGPAVAPPGPTTSSAIATPVTPVAPAATDSAGNSGIPVISATSLPTVTPPPMPPPPRWTPPPVVVAPPPPPPATAAPTPPAPKPKKTVDDGF